MFNVAVNPQRISTIENMICTNPIPVIEEDSTKGKTNICKDLWNNEFKWKYVSVYMSKMESSRIINSYHIQVLSNV